MTWVKEPKQVDLPQHDRGVAYDNKRHCLLRRRLLDHSWVFLEWREGCTAWSGRGSKSYYPATLTITAHGRDARGLQLPSTGIDLLEGGRLTAARVVEHLPKIAKHFGVEVEDLPLIARNETWTWKD